MKLGHALVWTIVRRLAISQFGLEWNSLIKPGDKLPDGKRWDLDAIFSSDGAKEVQNSISLFDRTHSLIYVLALGLETRRGAFHYRIFH